MLYAAELHLRSAPDEPLGQVTGYHILSFFLHLIQVVNPALAAALHEEGGPRPFTLSLLRPKNGRASLRLTFLQEEVFASFADAVWRLPAEASLPLGGTAVACEGLATTPAQSRWAAFASFEELLEGAGEERKLRLAFLTPTTFRSKGERNVLFPEPSLVLGSLMARWNAFAPSALRLNLGQSVTSQVRLSGYRLTTRMLDFGSYQELGFCGQAIYELDERLPGDEARGLQALGAFASFSGIGAKTTMGMGQCRRWENARPLPHGARGHHA